MPIIRRDSECLTKVVAVATGLCLFDLLKAIEQPPFDMVWRPSTGYFSHDLAFCSKARSVGFRLFVDQGLSRQVSNIGDAPFNQEWADHDARAASSRMDHTL
jgi:hypothetical protein